jgi:3-oxoacyl-[acyl-carrier protein] reductase
MFDLELTGKVALVTGGSDGLGRAAARRLAAEGASVVICGRRAEHLAAAAAELSDETGGAVRAITADVADAEPCARLVAGTVEAFGGLDILVNNAGTSAASSLMDLDDDAWRTDFELKVMAAVRLCRLAVPHMRERGGGAIVNASIGGAKAPPARQLPTSLSRAAGLNLTKSLSAEFAPENIRVNAICIGLIESAQWDRRAGDRPVEELYTAMAGRIPMGRVGRADEYGDLVAFLCSARAAYVTGTAVNLDGGLCPVL